MNPKESEEMTDDRKRAIFKALVERQDRGMTVDASRAELVEEYSLSLAQVMGIEREGIDKQWPPL